jgi:hypothetical protein
LDSNERVGLKHIPLSESCANRNSVTCLVSPFLRLFFFHRRFMFPSVFQTLSFGSFARLPHCFTSSSISIFQFWFFLFCFEFKNSVFKIDWWGRCKIYMNLIQSFWDLETCWWDLGRVIEFLNFLIASLMVKRWRWLIGAGIYETLDDGVLCNWTIVEFDGGVFGCCRQGLLMHDINSKFCYCLFLFSSCCYYPNF